VLPIIKAWVDYRRHLSSIRYTGNILASALIAACLAAILIYDQPHLFLIGFAITFVVVEVSLVLLFGRACDKIHARTYYTTSKK